MTKNGRRQETRTSPQNTPAKQFGEPHDTASQKNIRPRVTDRPELADKRSKKVAIAELEGPASRELEWNTQWLRPVPEIVRGHTSDTTNIINEVGLTRTYGKTNDRKVNIGFID
jgi:hypothetical protein